MLRRMRIAAISGASSLYLIGAGALWAGPIQPSDALVPNQAINSSETLGKTIPGEILTSGQEAAYFDLRTTSTLTEAGPPAGALAYPFVETPDASVSTSGSASSGMWHPGLEDGQILAAPVSLSSGAANPSIPENNPIIPLPNAAWTGLTMLLLLAVVRFFRNFRRLLT